MNIIVLQYGKPWEAVASTSLIKGLRWRHEGCSITWATSPENYPLFQFNNRLSEICVGYGPFSGKFDIAINLTPTEEAGSVLKNLSATSKHGFIFESDKIRVTNQENEKYIEVLRNEQTTTKNILQILYRLSDLKWKGEGYDLAYYPKNRMKKRKTGVAVIDESLRVFVKENLSLDYSQLWHVPLRTNLLKRIDEINRVKHLITDDLFCAHVGIAMHKHVEFLDKINLNMNIEFFGKGYHHRIHHAAE